MNEQTAVDAIYRSESRRVLATLIRLLGGFDLAEEALHEAFAAAVEQWPREGMPANPRAWLISVLPVVILEKPGSDAERQSSPAYQIDARRNLGEMRGIAITDRRAQGGKTDAAGDGGQPRQDRPAFQDRLVGRAHAGDLDHVIHDREPDKAVIFRPLRLRLHRFERLGWVETVEPGGVVNAELHGCWIPFRFDGVAGQHWTIRVVGSSSVPPGHQLIGHGFQNPCDGMRNARLKRADEFSHAMIIVSSAMVSSSKCRCTRAKSSSSTSRCVSVIASAYSSATFSASLKSGLFA